MDNAAVGQQELERWATQPDEFTGYYRFPAEDNAVGRTYRANFNPLITGATVTLWTGATIGRVISARVYRHNLGARFVALRIKGTNGADYHGRASWDGGNVINLRKCKGAK